MLAGSRTSVAAKPPRPIAAWTRPTLCSYSPASKIGSRDGVGRSKGSIERRWSEAGRARPELTVSNRMVLYTLPFFEFPTRVKEERNAGQGSGYAARARGRCDRDIDRSMRRACGLWGKQHRRFDQNEPELRVAKLGEDCRRAQHPDVPGVCADLVLQGGFHLRDGHHRIGRRHPQSDLDRAGDKGELHANSVPRNDSRGAVWPW